MNFFKQFDFFGNQMGLYYDGNRTVKTKIGGFLCLFSGIILVLLIIGFGQDFFKRENPLVIREIENLKSYPVYNITNKDFNVAVRLEDNEGNRLPNDKYFYLYPVLISYYKENDTWINLNTGFLDMVNCTEDMFDDNELFKDKGLEGFQCP